MINQIANSGNIQEGLNSYVEKKTQICQPAIIALDGDAEEGCKGNKEWEAKTLPSPLIWFLKISNWNFRELGEIPAKISHPNIFARFLIASFVLIYVSGIP